MLGVTRSEAEGRSPAELLHLLRGRQRSHRRRVNLLSWFLEELQLVLQEAVARGIRIAFSDKKRLSGLESSHRFAARAPHFDLIVEESDDGR